MKYKIGDKVKFLNDVGGGVIIKILSPTMVEVAVEDGFNIPVLVSELLFAQSENLKEAVFNQDFDIAPESIPNMEEENEYDRMSKLQKFASLQNNPSGLYLAYVPHDQVWLLKDDIDIFLVNYTSFELLYSFNIVKNDKKYHNIDYGNILPQHKVLLQTVSREELEEYSNGIVQALAFKEENDNIYLPIHQSFSVKLVRFMKKESFLPSKFLAEKAILIYLGQPRLLEMTEKTKILKNDNIDFVPAQSIAEKPIIAQYAIEHGVAEIDLHIETLVEDHSNMDSAQIIDIQRKKIISTMESAINNHYKKVIFIHGVGNGVLKNELIKILKQYSNVHYFDASMQKYGCGATEVLIKG